MTDIFADYDLFGKQFGKLTVIAPAPPGPRGQEMAFCRCECGTIKSITRGSLTTRGRPTVSCGCSRKDHIKHGHTRKARTSPTYNSWTNMLHRCHNPNTKEYANYGGRGITVCERWLKFENFLEDMGECPEGLTLDRFPDNDGPYTKDNCRWATRTEQQNNMRSNHLLTLGDVTQSITMWSVTTGLTVNAIHWRLKSDWTVEEALTTPLIPRMSNSNCHRGHLMDDANTIIQTSGGRERRRCRQCKNERDERYEAKKVLRALGIKFH